MQTSTKEMLIAKFVVKSPSAGSLHRLFSSNDCYDYRVIEVMSGYGVDGSVEEQERGRRKQLSVHHACSLAFRLCRGDTFVLR